MKSVIKRGRWESGEESEWEGSTGGGHRRVIDRRNGRNEYRGTSYEGSLIADLGTGKRGKRICRELPGEGCLESTGTSTIACGFFTRVHGI